MEVVSFTPCLLYPGERAPGTHWTGGWMGPVGGLDAAGNRTSAFQSIAIPTKKQVLIGYAILVLLFR
jgi:hypothetical protein